MVIKTYRIYETSISASHVIPWQKDKNGHPGKCTRDHGHNYRMKFFIEVVGDEWIDFYDVKEWIENILSDFDHTNITKEYDISTVEQFSYVVRSRVSEIFQEKTGLPNRDVQIEIYETDKFGVRTLDDGT